MTKQGWVLWLFWVVRDHLGEARTWAGQLLPTTGSFDLQAQVELGWTAAAIDAEVGDDQAALAARERLAPLLDEIGDPYLRAVSLLVMGWTAGIVVGDYDGALRQALVSLEQLRGQDEPLWTAMAVYTAGLAEMTIGRYEDALRHLTEARDLAERLDNPWLAAVSRVCLGNLAVAQGRPEEARGLLNEALDLSLAGHSTRSVTLCLGALARLALAEGDPEQAALLVGQPRGCAGGSACRSGRCCDKRQPSWSPRSARHWARTGSANSPPLAPGSASRRRWPPSATSAARAAGHRERGDPAGRQHRRRRADRWRRSQAGLTLDADGTRPAAAPGVCRG